jgi:uncharacterized membrane protein YphA (DoxX/SURF4 family)
MKLITNIVRVLTGVLFIFSGFIKLNDPTGFKIKLEEYFNVFAADLSPAKDTMVISIKNADLALDETYRRTLNNEDKKIVSYLSAPWEHVEVKDDAGQIQAQFDKTTLNINLDGQELLKQSIQKEDAAPTKFDITVSVGGKVLLTKTISVFNNVPITGEDGLDLVAYKKSPGFLVNLCLWLIPYTLFLAIFICVFEIILGITLLIGWRRNLTLWLLALMIVFFTFLTWYSATYNKVTDCGCFGNAIPLTPWESFIKDLVLSGCILILIVLRKYIKPVFSPGFSRNLVIICSALSVGFTFYCWYYLPVFNFLKFKKGNDIEKLTTLPPNAKKEVREMVFIYTKDGKDYEFTTAQLTEKGIMENPAYKYKDRLDKVIEEGDKPEIHDFMMADQDGVDHAAEFFEKDEYKLLFVSQGLAATRERPMKKIAELAKDFTEKSKLQFWALTSSAPADAEVIRHQYQFMFKFYYGDNTNLKSIIRSNPGLLLFKKSTVVETWPSTDLPDYEEVLEIMKAH